MLDKYNSPVRPSSILLKVHWIIMWLRDWGIINDMSVSNTYRTNRYYTNVTVCWKCVASAKMASLVLTALAVKQTPVLTSVTSVEWYILQFWPNPQQTSKYTSPWNFFNVLIRYGVNSILSIPLNSMWSIPIPIYQFQFRFLPTTFYHE